MSHSSGSMSMRKVMSTLPPSLSCFIFTTPQSSIFQTVSRAFVLFGGENIHDTLFIMLEIRDAGNVICRIGFFGYAVS